MKLIISILILSINCFGSDITYLADCKYSSFEGLKVVEIAKIGDGLGANLQGGPYEYFFAEIVEGAQIEADENSFKFLVRTDTFSYVEVNFETGRGRIQQRLLPTYHDCMGGGNPSACLIFNEVLHSCKRRDYTPSLFN